MTDRVRRPDVDDEIDDNEPSTLDMNAPGSFAKILAEREKIEAERARAAAEQDDDEPSTMEMLPETNPFTSIPDPGGDTDDDPATREMSIKELARLTQAATESGERPTPRASGLDPGEIADEPPTRIDSTGQLFSPAAAEPPAAVRDMASDDEIETDLLKKKSPHAASAPKPFAASSARAIAVPAPRVGPAVSSSPIAARPAVAAPSLTASAPAAQATAIGAPATSGIVPVSTSRARPHDGSPIEQPAAVPPSASQSMAGNGANDPWADLANDEGALRPMVPEPPMPSPPRPNEMMLPSAKPSAANVSPFAIAVLVAIAVISAVVGAMFQDEIFGFVQQLLH